METENKMVSRGSEEGETRGRFMGMEFQFHKMRKFWRSAAQQCEYPLLDCALKNG